MDNDALEGRLAALEVMLFAIAQQLKSAEFIADLNEQKEFAITGLLSTTASDQKIAVLERTVERYVSALGLTP